MKHKLIKTDNYLLIVDDSEIKEGDFLYSINNKLVVCANKGSADTINSKVFSEVIYKKIIAHLPLHKPFIYGYTPSPILEGVDLLPELEQEDDVEKLADNFMEYFGGDKNLKYGYVHGWTECKEKYKYTEEDMIKFSEYCRNTARREGTYGEGFTNNWELTSEQKIVTTKWLLEKFIQSLSQLKMPIAFECEREFVENKLWGQKGTGIYKNRTTSNPQNQTVWVGKWIY